MRVIEVALVASLALSAGQLSAKSHDDEPKQLSAVGRTNIGLAQSYLQANKLQDALDRAKRAVRSDPKFGEPHAMLGMVYAKTGDQKNAAEEFDKALKLAPDSGSILNVHAVWLCEQGQYDQAIAEFAKALADPFYTNPAQANFNAGRCQQKAGRMPQAEASLRTALSLSPSDPEVLFTLAQVELAQGSWLEARAFVQRRLALGATAEALELAASIEDAAGDKDAAGQYRKRLQDEFPAQAPTNDGTSGQ
jgi:type IV pilus assembly protein PilF